MLRLREPEPPSNKPAQPYTTQRSNIQGDEVVCR